MTSKTYSEKQKAAKSAEKNMFQLAWKIQELGEFNEDGRKIIIECGNMKTKLLQPNSTTELVTLCKKTIITKTEGLDICQASGEVQVHTCDSHSSYND